MARNLRPLVHGSVNLTRSEDSTDPVQALEPPANETPEERAVRDAKEAETRRVSGA
jgi:hypothetical protein